MKISYSINSNIKWILPIMCLLMSVLISGCARKMNFGVSQVTPAAEGFVKIKKDQNDNKIINVQVKNLAAVNRLNPPRDFYVVWMKTENNGTQNIGRLKSSSGLFSNALNAELKTVTAFEPVNFFITAENNATVQIPSYFIVLETK